MTAREYLRNTALADMVYARGEYHSCRQRGLPIMTQYYRREMVRAYMTLRGLRK